LDMHGRIYPLLPEPFFYHRYFGLRHREPNITERTTRQQVDHLLPDQRSIHPLDLAEVGSSPRLRSARNPRQTRNHLLPHHAERVHAIGYVQFARKDEPNAFFHAMNAETRRSIIMRSRGSRASVTARW